MLSDDHFVGCDVLDADGARIGTLHRVDTGAGGIFAIVRTLQAEERRMAAHDAVYDSGARTLTLARVPAS